MKTIVLGAVLLGICLFNNFISNSDSALAITANLSITQVPNINLEIDENNIAYGITNFTVTATKTTNFMVYAGGTYGDRNFVGNGVNNSEIIARHDGAATAPSNFAANTWGVCVNNLADSCQKGNEFKSYYGIGVTRQAKKLYDTETWTRYLAYAAKLSDDLYADTYTNTQVISVVAEDYEAFSTISSMQEMTKEVCAAEPIPPVTETEVPTKQLIDIRDGKKILGFQARRRKLLDDAKPSS